MYKDIIYENNEEVYALNKDEVYKGKDIKQFLKKNKGAYVIVNGAILNDDSKYKVMNGFGCSKNLIKFDGDYEETNIKQVYRFQKVDKQVESIH